MDYGLRFKKFESFFVFSFIKLGVFSFAHFLFLWEGPLILLLFSSLYLVSFLLLI